MLSCTMTLSVRKEKTNVKNMSFFYYNFTFFYISKPLKINSRSTRITADTSCAVYISSRLQGSTAACVGLKITEEQWLLSCVCGQKQTNKRKKNNTTSKKKKQNRKFSVQWFFFFFFQAWQGEFQSSLSLDCPIPSLSRPALNHSVVQRCL